MDLKEQTKEILLKKINTFIELNEYNQARELAQSYITENPSDEFFLCLLGFILYKIKDLITAQVYLSRVIQQNPRSTNAQNILGNLYRDVGDFSRAKECFEKAISIDPTQIDPRYNLGIIYQQLGELHSATQCYRDLLELQPGHVLALNNLAVIEYSRKKYLTAVSLYDKAISSDSENAMLLNNRSAALKELGRLNAAMQDLEKAIALDNSYADAHINLGNLFRLTGQKKGAIKCYLQARTIMPRNPEIYKLIGIAHHEECDWLQAEANYKNCLDLNPQQPLVLNNLGAVFKEQEKYSEALECFTEALSIDNSYARALSNRAAVFLELGAIEESLKDIEEAIRLEPNSAEFLINQAVILLKIKNNIDALRSISSALKLDNKNQDALYHLGNIHLAKGDHSEAISAFNQCLAINPDHQDALNNLGIALQEKKDYVAALRTFKTLASLNLDYPYLQGTIVHLKMLMCDWEGYSVDVKNLQLAVSSGKKACPPFPLLALIDDPALHLLAAKTAMQERSSKIESKPIQIAQTKKIRVGYFSADFYNHATMYLMAELFELYDRDRFEIFLFSLNSPVKDEMFQRLIHAGVSMYDLSQLTDQAAVSLCRDLKLHIGVDLKGFTGSSRPDIFAMRCAPIQINWLGYPGTIGSGYMDYIIADNTLITESDEQYYSEKVIAMPYSYQINDQKRKRPRLNGLNIPGVSKDQFIYASLGNNFKITPRRFATWMRILGTVQNSVLLLLRDNIQAANNMLLAASRHGIDPNRLIFLDRCSYCEHLARHEAIDLVLDTSPYNAHTTASDALWMGIPILTLKGNSFASRVAASLLNTVHLDELITHDERSYEILAITLGKNKDMLDGLKQKLLRELVVNPLFDSKRFICALESAYQMVVSHRLSGGGNRNIRLTTDY